MAKLTKQQTKMMERVNDLVHSDKPLTFEEKKFILENFHEGANTNNSALGAFFTPYLLARDFSLETNISGNCIDLCAGIGILSFHHRLNNINIKRHVCVELNHTYYEVGKRVVPEAEWVLMDALSYEDDTIFDIGFSNPPFGNIKTSQYKDLKYTGSEFEYKIIEKIYNMCEYGAFIIPQGSSSFKYSGKQLYEKQESNKLKKFIKDTGIILEPNCGIDTSLYLDSWNGVSPMCEIVLTENTNIKQPSSNLDDVLNLELLGL